ncbi:hypothetical protein [Synechococcus sp. CBW1107]|uniref:hypothetical protein n=1 Tax=Synechococcus sp. CBW1107 TaxID=2789857 RepID=UPI001E606228|nr:hypothetical protein [Synechococcus sp. CBW1107]
MFFLLELVEELDFELIVSPARRRRSGVRRGPFLPNLHPDLPWQGPAKCLDRSAALLVVDHLSPGRFL